MNRPFLKSGCAAIALLATACTGVLIEDAPGLDSRASYYRGEFDYATRNGAIMTTIVGNPFAAPKPGFDARVVGLMKEQNRGVPAEFVAAHGARTDPVFSVVVAFNMAPGISPNRLCREPATVQTAPHSRDLRMSAAFCHGDALQSDAAGVAYQLAGPDDPKFAELVRGVTNAMVPIDTSEEGDGGDSVMP